MNWKQHYLHIDIYQCMAAMTTWCLPTKNSGCSESVKQLKKKEKGWLLGFSLINTVVVGGGGGGSGSGDIKKSSST